MEVVFTSIAQRKEYQASNGNYPVQCTDPPYRRTQETAALRHRQGTKPLMPMQHISQDVRKRTPICDIGQ